MSGSSADKIVEKYDGIGLTGLARGTLTCSERGLEWRGATTTKLVQVGCEGKARVEPRHTL